MLIPKQINIIKYKILIIEEDGATCHKSKKNTKLLNSLFGEDDDSKILQISKDFAYVIEDLSIFFNKGS